MAYKSKRRSLYIVSIILIFIVSGLAYAAYAAFSGTDNKTVKSSNPATVIDKVKTAQLKGGTLELTEEDLNAVVKPIVNRGIQKGNITVKDAYVDIVDGKVGVYALTKYNNTEVLLNTVGEVKIEGDKVVFTPASFKAGKLALPKALVMDQLKKFSNDTAVITEDRIEIPKEKLPLNIESLSVGEDKIITQVKKFNTSSIFSPIVDENKTADNKAVEDPKGTSNSTIQNNQGKQSSSKVSKNQSTAKNSTLNASIEKRRVLLKKISSQLSAARGAVSGSQEKAVISTAISAVNKMAQNPAGGIITNGLRSKYNQLTPEQKSRVKTAIFNNVDMGAAAELAKLFGM
jgi:hypothetical protein